MKYRTLGRTAIKVTPYCLGAMMFGGIANSDHDDCIRIIHKGGPKQTAEVGQNKLPKWAKTNCRSGPNQLAKHKRPQRAFKEVSIIRYALRNRA